MIENWVRSSHFSYLENRDKEECLCAIYLKLCAHSWTAYVTYLQAGPNFPPFYKHRLAHFADVMQHLISMKRI